MKAFRKSWPQCINCRYQCTLGHVTSGCAFLVAVCIFMLPMLEVATGHVQLTSRGHKNHTDPHHMIKHTPLLLPSLYYVLPAMVLQNDVVRSNMWCLSCSLFYSYVHHDTSSLCLSVPSGLWRKVVEIVVVLLLLMGGDIERNPGPVGEYTVRSEVSFIHVFLVFTDHPCYIVQTSPGSLLPGKFGTKCGRNTLCMLF